MGLTRTEEKQQEIWNGSKGPKKTGNHWLVNKKGGVVNYAGLLRQGNGGI